MAKIFVKELIWDEWNIAHIARHGVVKEEVEQVCESEFVSRDSYDGRYLVIGFTSVGRMITVILDPEFEKDVYYPVTARPTAKRERKYYDKEKGDDHNKTS
jgi:uncharacterized DUF497 family protein